jgi:hypothetical protein
MSLKRKAVREAMKNIDGAILEAHKLSPEDIKKHIKALQDMVDRKDTDPRTRKMCLEYLLEHSYVIYAHEHPAVEKIDVTHKGLAQPPRELTVRIIGPDKKGKNAADKR